MRKIIAFTLFICVSANYVFSQVYPFRTYSIDAGLSESVVNDIIQDYEGYIWMGTGFGLNKFDGNQFETFFEDQGLNSGRIYSLFEDSKNRIWVGTDKGVNYIIADSVYSHEGYSSLSAYTVSSIFEDSEGQMWFGTDGGGVWHYYDEKNFVVYTTSNGLSNNQVRAIVQAANGDIYFATRNGLSVLSDGNFRNYFEKDGLPEYRLRDLIIDPNNPSVIWIATRKGLSKYENGTFTNYGREFGIRDEKIHTISIDSTGTIWSGTEAGVSEFDGKKFINYSTEQGLAADIVYSSFTDREGNVWFGTMGGGANIFLGKYFENYTTENGLPNGLVTDIAQTSSNELWIAMYGGGLVKKVGGEFEYFYSQQGLPDNRVYHLSVDSKNRMWIGMRDGLSYMENQNLVNLSDDDFPFRKVRNVNEARDGSYWISTYDDGLIQMKNRSITQYNIEAGLPNNTVVASVEAADGTIWAATYGGVATIKDGEINTYLMQDGLPHNGIMGIIEDNTGTIWVSTYGGVAWFDGVRFVDITDADGLPGRVCYFIEQDNEGYFWIGTNEGIARLDIQMFYSENQVERYSAIQTLTDEQGLVSNETNLGAVYEHEDGSLWFGTIEGVSRFIPKNYRGNNVPPTIKLQSFSAAGHQYFTSNIELDNERNFVEINFSAINFTAPNQVVYEYRLSGIDPQWQQTRQHFARYPSLPPGEYTFRVRARNSSGIWSNEYASISFKISPPFWMSWWFIALIASIIFGIIYLFYRNYKYMKMVDMERMRVRIASDLHDDVGASLTEIALQSDFLQASSIDSEFRKSLVQIGEQCRKIVTSLDDIVWSIDARNDTLGDLTDRIQDYSINVLGPKNFEVTYNFEELKMEEKLPVTVKENLYLIFKEAINNIAKYSNGDKVHVEMNSNYSTFKFRIHDNGNSGKGLKKTGHGLRNMEMRAQRIGGNVNIAHDDGFSISITGKLNLN
jgi:ligand-binding sensor domain-containing protein